MDRKLSDEQVDRIAANLLRDFALDDATLDEIAESPRLWWNVKSRIEREKARRGRRWFAAWRFPALIFGALAVVFCFGAARFFLNSESDLNSTVAEKNPVRNSFEESIKGNENLPAKPFNADSNESEISKKTNPAAVKMTAKTTAPKSRIVVNEPPAARAKSPFKPSEKEISPKAAVQSKEETKTDFIALSYAAGTDSGQIVRVKVPSSMMVSLGLKTNIEKESEMVNAEVVVGDDGLARAIRFIR